MQKNWTIKLHNIQAIDEQGYILPYRSKMNKRFKDRDEFDKYISERTKYVKTKYGEKTTITKTYTNLNDKTMNLYKLTNKLAEWWILAKDTKEAEKILKSFLDKYNYGFEEERKASKIELITSKAGEECFITGHHLLSK